MNRKLAREAAYLTVFGYLFTGELDERAYASLAESPDLTDAGSVLFDPTLAGELDAKDLDYISRTIRGVVDREKELKGIIAKYSKGFVLDRIYKPDLAILLISVYEMIYDDEIPLKVSISEAVGIVKRYSTTKSYSYVNGILASVYRELTEEKNGENN